VALILSLMAGLTAGLTAVSVAAVRIERSAFVSAAVARSLPGLQPGLDVPARGRSAYRACLWMGRTALGRRLGKAPALAERLDLAGRPRPIEWVAGLKAILVVGGMVFVLSVAISGPPGLLLGTLLAAGGLRGPEFVLARMGRRRRAAIDARLPELIELLVATTQAGLGPPIALRRSAEVLRGPLAAELAVTVHEIELGLPWREALAGLAARTGAPTLRRLVGSLTRSQRIGAPLAVTLRRVSDDLRGERSARIEEQARQAPVKMLFPLVFLVLPAFLLLTVGPVVVATIRSLH